MFINMLMIKKFITLFIFSIFFINDEGVVSNAFIIDAIAQEKSLLIQSTTSTENSGLYDYILPKFKEETGIHVYVVAVGTGQAIKNAQNGDGDILIVHSKEDEENFIKKGYGEKRYDLMYNDFVLVGHKDNLANITHDDSIFSALQKIEKTQSKFISRGDKSGTHKRELALMKKSNININRHNGKWYLETGSGMGQALNITVELNGYTITDRATWEFFKNKRNHVIFTEGDKDLFNQYSIIIVKNKDNQNEKRQLSQRFLQWILSPKGQQIINSYRINDQQVFFANANDN